MQDFLHGGNVSKHPFIGKGVISLMIDDQVVQYRKIQELASRFHLTCQLDIGIARLNIPRRMIMSQDDGTGIGFQGHLEDDLRVGHGAGDPSGGNPVPSQGFVGPVQAENVELLDALDVLAPDVQENPEGVAGGSHLAHL